MARKKKNPVTSPLTFDLPVSLIAKIDATQKKHGFRFTSELVREAVASFDIERCVSAGEPHRQISVRLPAEMKAKLTKAAKKKKVSIGEILRVALESYAPKAAAKKGRRG
ncbi:metal-responsive CopG/Arc/MetJ family transcriptional regulator [Ereboglobus sp. PH5-10]|uniref:ribbon-helix-helix protein, CopG family n=1 Tax=Ereboglobus sp. PH5-10 TaxID=2940629 RepID=UPI0024055D9D|nr:ribbon-helix-helix protein, CopG family [Ereboglobus sp. PH5-10]MDF9826605.1 metal-responsive CopG/Arc/MetJ family transcriptional regulator [Ereboglobus sp. PH5-10]